MKLKLNIAASALLMAVAATAVAAPPLTPQQCNDYPFKQPVRGVTRAQLKQELVELENTGYDPGINDVYYPRDIQRAEKKLQAEYRQDCRPAVTAAGMSG